MKENELQALTSHNDEPYYIFSRIFEEYYCTLCYFANKMVNDRPAAEDLVKDTFLNLWKRNPEFVRYQNVKSYLYTTVKNACLNFIRQQKRQRLKNNELTYLTRNETEDFVLNAIVKTEVVTSIYEELQKLPPQCRTVMHLIYKEGWSNQQIADHLNVTESTVRNQKARALKVLRGKFGAVTLLLVFDNIRHLSDYHHN